MADKLAYVQIGRSVTRHRGFRNAETTFCGRMIRDGAVWSNRERDGCPECMVRDPQRSEFIEFLLDYLASVSMMKVDSHRNRTKMSVRPQFFDGAEPFLKTDLTHGQGAFDDYDVPDIKNVRLPMDFRAIMRIGSRDDGNESDPKRWTLTRMRSVDAREIRGKVRISLPYPMQYTFAVPSDDTVRQLYIGKTGKRWIELDNWGVPPLIGEIFYRDGDDVATKAAEVSLYYWSLRPQQWRVYFSIDGKPGIELPTDPTGARAAFRLRDIPEGKSRRLALMNWVTEHWRINRHDPSEEIKVREHLRGATDFSWSGLRCKIKPSDVAVGRNEQSIETREEDRKHGLDRRKVTTS